MKAKHYFEMTKMNGNVFTKKILIEFAESYHKVRLIEFSNKESDDILTDLGVNLNFPLNIVNKKEDEFERWSISKTVKYILSKINPH